MTLSRIFTGLLSCYFLIGMHVLLPTPGGAGLYLSYNTIGWLITSILISLGLWQIAQRKRITLDRFLPVMFIALVLFIIPLFYSGEHTHNAIPRLLAIFGGILFWLALNQFKNDEKSYAYLLTLIVAAAVIETFIGLAQFAFFEQGSWLGYDPSRHRPHGALIQPNVAATLITTGVLLSCYLLVRAESTSKHSFLLWGCLIFCPIVLVLLQSRVGFLSGLVGLLIILPYLFYSHRKRASLILVLITCSIAVGTAVLQNSEVPKRDHIDYSDGGERKDIYIVSLKMIADKPLTGFGYGNFQRAYLDYHNMLKREDPSIANPLLRLGHPHNEILYWGIEGGVVPIIAFVIIAVAFIKLLMKVPDWRLRLALVSVILPVTLHSQTSLPFYMSLSHWLILLLLVWYIKQNAPQTNYTVSFPANFLMKSLAVINVGIFVPFFVTTLHTNLIISAFESTGYRYIHWLKKIVNPLPWKERLELNTHSYMLIQGLASNDHNKMQTYIDWAKKRIKHTPRVALYNNIILLLKKMNRQAEAEEITKEAQLTYPLHIAWGEDLFIERGN